VEEILHTVDFMRDHLGVCLCFLESRTLSRVTLLVWLACVWQGVQTECTSLLIELRQVREFPGNQTCGDKSPIAQRHNSIDGRARRGCLSLCSYSALGSLCAELDHILHKPLIQRDYSFCRLLHSLLVSE
jgi:hypothetical protein